jgi:hypothetical protein
MAQASMHEHRSVFEERNRRIRFSSDERPAAAGTAENGGRTQDIEIDGRPLRGHNPLDQAEDFAQGVPLIALTNGYS